MVKLGKHPTGNSERIYLVVFRSYGMRYGTQGWIFYRMLID